MVYIPITNCNELELVSYAVANRVLLTVNNGNSDAGNNNNISDKTPNSVNNLQETNLHQILVAEQQQQSVMIQSLQVS